MGNEGKITLEEAVKLLAVAKLQIAEQQQELKSKDAVISEKDLKINAQISLPRKSIFWKLLLSLNELWYF